MLRRIATVGICALLAGHAVAQDLSACGKLAAAVDFVDRAAAMRFVDSLGDNSAARETNRKLDLANDLAVAQIAVTLAVAQKCAPLPALPSGGGLIYMDAAFACNKARQAGGNSPPECDMNKWKPSVRP